MTATVRPPAARHGLMGGGVDAAGEAGQDRDAGVDELVHQPLGLLDALDDWPVACPPPRPTWNRAPRACRGRRGRGEVEDRPQVRGVVVIEHGREADAQLVHLADEFLGPPAMLGQLVRSGGQDFQAAACLRRLLAGPPCEQLVQAARSLRLSGHEIPGDIAHSTECEEIEYVSHSSPLLIERMFGSTPSAYHAAEGPRLPRGQADRALGAPLASA